MQRILRPTARHPLLRGLWWPRWQMVKQCGVDPLLKIDIGSAQRRKQRLPRLGKLLGVHPNEFSYLGNIDPTTACDARPRGPG